MTEKIIWKPRGQGASTLIAGQGGDAKEVEGRFIEWLQERNEDGIYKLTVHPQTLKAFYNQHDEWHEELSAFLKVHEKIRIGTRTQK